MRTDPGKDEQFTESSAWKSQRYGFQFLVPQPAGSPLRYKVNSFSGNEANHFFLNAKGEYYDCTMVSGVDHLGDGRGFAVLDYDGDGWQDIALVSTNKPLFQLYRNQLSEFYPGNQRVRFKLEGRQTTAKASEGASNRDGIGAQILVTYKSGKKRLLHRQAGEGNVAQNSPLIWIGKTEAQEIDHLEVLWPSGKRSTHDVFKIDQVNVLQEP